MKKATLFITACLFAFPVLAQVANDVAEDSLAGFQLDVALRESGEAHDPGEANHQIEVAKRNYIDQKYQLGRYAPDYQYPGTVYNNAVFPVASCSNADFEDGSFSGWSGLIGDNTVSCFAAFTNQQMGIFSNGIDAPLNNSLARHTLITPAFGNDFYGNFPGVPSGSGNYTVRLGGQTPNCQGEQLEQTFTVSPNSTSFAYRYAVVFSDPPSGHLSTSKPYFRIEVLDQNGQPISNCTQYFDTSSVNAPGYFLSPHPDPSLGNGVYYKPWTTINFDLTGYVGQNITVRFTVAGCTQTGHFGYAYVDCSCSNLAANVNFCPGNTFLYLNAPAGYGSYQWLDPNHNPIPGATNDTLFVNNPVVGDTFFVYLVSAIDTSCHNTLPVVLEYTHIFPNATGDTVCYQYPSGVISAAGTAGFPPYTYVWNTTPQSFTATVQNVMPGNYIVDMTDSLGCESFDTVTVAQLPKPDTSSLKYDYCYGDDHITITAPPGYYDYIWIGPNGDTLTPMANANQVYVTGVQLGGEYTCIEFPSSTVAPPNCPIYDSILVAFHPPLSWFKPDSLVNVFTPNNDGKNDFFYPFETYLVSNQTQASSQPGYDFSDMHIMTYEMWIYDRWGNQVFYTNDYHIGWNGQTHGKDDTVGVYYYITKIVSSCDPYGAPTENHGFVHLIRD
jgi:hypothetical protein